MSNIISALVGAALGGGAILWTLLFLHKRAEVIVKPPAASQRESARWCDCGADCC